MCACFLTHLSTAVVSATFTSRPEHEWPYDVVRSVRICSEQHLRNSSVGDTMQRTVSMQRVFRPIREQSQTLYQRMMLFDTYREIDRKRENA